VSKEMSEFAELYKIKLLNSSPYYAAVSWLLGTTLLLVVVSALAQLTETVQWTVHKKTTKQWYFFSEFNFHIIVYDHVYNPENTYA
jgi:hypothetical protein